MSTGPSKTPARLVVGLAVYVLALATILYPAYGPGSYIRQGLGTITSVLVSAVVSLILAALLFGTRFLARPAWALIAAVLGLVGAFGGAEWTGVPVILGGGAAHFASQARKERPSDRLVIAAIVVGLLAILVTIAVVIFEPLTD